MTARRKIAVVLFNLGGPDGPDAVRPFLFNLFNDPAIISLPGLIRTPVANLISTRREESAKANYAIMGGGSPLLPETRKQAAALEVVLSEKLDAEIRCIVAMRYWHPMTEEAARQVEAFAPDEIVLLPLYPQFSTTTTGSSLKAWNEVYRGPGRSRAVCCYPAETHLVEAHARAIEAAYEKAGQPGPARLLFSAHGLPEKVIKSGDPYQAQVEATCAAVVARLSGQWDWRVCFQSRVGPMKWIGPSTDAEITRCGAEGLVPVISPIAFVSEHVETLVELDHEYAELGRKAGCPDYVRVPALGVDDLFIEGLAQVAISVLDKGPGQWPEEAYSCSGFRQCARTIRR